MLFLKGEKGKGKLILDLIESNEDDLIISIGDKVSFANYIIDNGDFKTLKELLLYLEDKISENCKYVVFYTNFSSDELKPYVECISEFESKMQNLVRSIIITSK